MSILVIKERKIITATRVLMLTGLVILFISVAHGMATPAATSQTESKEIDTERFCYYKNLAYSEGAEIGTKDGRPLLCKRKMIWIED